MPDADQHFVLLHFDAIPKLTSMLCSDLTSHWCISQAPGRLELAASCQSSDALIGSRTAAMT
jgi:hypothetical protein